jgi:hypothetical protein
MKVFKVTYYWAPGFSSEPNVYYVRSKETPTKEAVIEAFDLNYQPEVGEEIVIIELEVVTL